MSKFYKKKGAEEIYLVSKSESSLSSFTIREVIEKFIPHQKKSNWYFEINYDISDAGSSSKKVTLYYELFGGPVYVSCLLIGFLLGGILSFFISADGVLNLIIGFFFLGLLFSCIGYGISKFIKPSFYNAKNEAERICNNIVIGLKELERAQQ